MDVEGEGGMGGLAQSLREGDLGQQEGVTRGFPAGRPTDLAFPGPRGRPLRI